MSVVYGLENLTEAAHGRVVAVGVFDGVHWGHRAIFDRLIEVASRTGQTACALTFDKHPAEVLAPTRAPMYINTLDQRIELIKAIGVEEIIVAEFGPKLAGLSRDEFVRRILCEAMRAGHLVVGSNFRFGKGREGDVRYLAAAAPELGIELSIVPSVIIDKGPVSSTRVRAVVSRGDVVEAANLLGRRFALRGTVVMGEKIGRSLGFPTANIQTAQRQLLPARGVYVVEAAIGKSVYGGVCNIGNRPTFGGGSQTIEVHLAGFEGMIYGTVLDVVFIRGLRDEMVFETPEKLAEQIRMDLERAEGIATDAKTSIFTDLRLLN